MLIGGRGQDVLDARGLGMSCGGAARKRSPGMPRGGSSERSLNALDLTRMLDRPEAGLRPAKEQKRISDPPDTAGEPLAKLTQAGLTRHQFILVTGFFFDLPAARLLPPDLADERLRHGRDARPAADGLWEMRACKHGKKVFYGGKVVFL